MISESLHCGPGQFISNSTLLHTIKTTENLYAMDCPELYIKENGMQRSSVKDVSSKYISKMTWKPNEIVIDIGCGPGDVTSDILYPIIKTKIKQLVNTFNIK